MRFCSSLSPVQTLVMISSLNLSDCNKMENLCSSGYFSSENCSFLFMSFSKVTQKIFKIAKAPIFISFFGRADHLGSHGSHAHAEEILTTGLTVSYGDCDSILVGSPSWDPPWALFFRLHSSGHLPSTPLDDRYMLLKFPFQYDA